MCILLLNLLLVVVSSVPVVVVVAVNIVVAILGSAAAAPPMNAKEGGEDRALAKRHHGEETDEAQGRRIGCFSSLVVAGLFNPTLELAPPFPLVVMLSFVFKRPPSSGRSLTQRAREREMNL